MRLIAGVVLIALASVAQAAPLTVRVGESWLFAVKDGQPANARKVAPAVAPTRGEVKVAVRAAFGTMMTITNNSAQGYTFDAQLVDATGKTVKARSCTLPPNNLPALENWPQKASAVRIGNFKPAKDGNC
jgi:hypothetical protein